MKSKTQKAILAEIGQYGYTQVFSGQVRRYAAMMSLRTAGVVTTTSEKCSDEKRGVFGRRMQGCFHHYHVWTVSMSRLQAQARHGSGNTDNYTGR